MMILLISWVLKFIFQKAASQRYLKFPPHPSPLPRGERGSFLKKVRDKFSDFNV